MLINCRNVLHSRVAHGANSQSSKQTGKGETLTRFLSPGGAGQGLQPGLHVPPPVRRRQSVQHQHVGHAALPGGITARARTRGV